MTAAEARVQAGRLEALAQSALALWRMEGSTLAPVKMRENAVFRVAAPDGRLRALRVHRAGYHDDAELESELAWMQALAEAGVDVPVVVPSAAGRLFEVVGHAAVTEPRQVDVFEWIDGTPLGSAGKSLQGDPDSLAGAFRHIGELCARVHNHSSCWRPPAGFRRPAWDAEGLAGERPLWGRFWELAALDAEQRALIERARAAVHAALTALPRPPQCYSLIHADLTPDNVLVEGERLRLIDFDDAGPGWHLFELATALYFHIGEPYYERIFAALIEGYRAHRALSDAELERLPLFYLARGLTYLGWVHTRAETETAAEMTPAMVERACNVAEAYLCA